MISQRILLTGAAGGLGRVLRAEFGGKVPLLRCTDIAAMAEAGPGEEVIVADLADRDAMPGLVDGIDSVIHLGGKANEGTWDQITAANIVGVINLYEAARAAGVKRILFASSNHAIGLFRRAQTIDHTVVPRPDSRYGLSKAFGEDVASLHAYKYGIKGFAMRIGSCFPKPINARMLSSWMSYPDFIRLVRVGLTADYTFEIVYGASRNTRTWWDNSNAHRLGYEPQDDAEIFAGEVGHIVSTDPLDEDFQGGSYVPPGFVGSGDRIP